MPEKQQLKFWLDKSKPLLNTNIYTIPSQQACFNHNEGLFDCKKSSSRPVLVANQELEYDVYKILANRSLIEKKTQWGGKTTNITATFRYAIEIFRTGSVY